MILHFLFILVEDIALLSHKFLQPLLAKKKKKTEWAPQPVIWVFGDIQYIPSLSINYIAINKDLEKLPPKYCCIR